MPRLIENALAHFNSKDLRKIEVPEWEVSLFAKNLTLDDKAKMLRRADSDNTDYLIYAVIFGLVDENGDPVFGLEDKVALRKKVDPDIVTRLATFALTSGSGSEEDREKNL
jgi:hypothetical protein